MTAVKGYLLWSQGLQGQILCSRQFMNSLDDSSLAEIKLSIAEEPWLAQFWEVGDKYIRTRDKRIWYTFAGLDKSIDSIKSKSRILLNWTDEAENVSEEAWRKLLPTIREEGSECWVTWNPENRDSPTDIRFKQQAKDDPHMIVVEMNWRDNPWFPQKLERERLRDKKNHPELYEHIWEGDYLEYITGAYFVDQLSKAREENRITNLPKLDSQPCFTFWDIGNSDGCAVWVLQVVGKEYRLIGFGEWWGKPYSEQVKWLRELGFVYETHFLPHDADHKRQGQVDNKSPKEMLEDLLPSHNFEIVPRIADINWGIQQTRDVFPMLWFDKEATHKGLEHIRQYRRRWSENERRWLDKPDKSEGHSESADALRQLGQAYANGQIGTKYSDWETDLDVPEIGIV